MKLSSKKVRTGLLAGSAAIILSFEAPASAQESSETKVGLEEIVVTAQHREEVLRDVPISINAVSASTLGNVGVADTAALVQAVPSLNFTRSGPSGIFVVRGVATPNGAPGEEGSTAVYIDDVYMPDLASTINTFNNIQRVEVVNGPQGTLFGRNATGGLIRVITRDPGYKTEMNARIGYGNYRTLSGQLYFATPISDWAGIDFALTGQDQGKGFGYNPTLKKDIRAQDYWGARSKLVLNPTDTLKLTVAGDYYRTDDDSATFTWGLNYNPATGVLTGAQSSQDSVSGFPNMTKIRAWGVSGKVEFDMDWATLASISAYRHLKNNSASDIAASAADNFRLVTGNINRTFQQELRLSSNSTEPLSWQMGAFFLRMNTDVDQIQGGAILRGANIHIVSEAITNSLAAFGEATYAVTPTTHLTGGIRWTRDHRELPVGYVDTLFGSMLISRSTNALRQVTYNNVTYRGALRQDLTDRINIYVSVNKGFKSGQFNLVAPNLPPVRPQTIMAYEGGLKGDFLDRRLRLNLAVFHYDIDDYQVRTTYPNPNGAGVITGLYNAAKVKIDGVDVNIEANPTDRLQLTAGASWLNSRFSQFGGPGTGILAPGYYPPSDPGNATGNQTPLAPRFSLNLVGTYTIPFDNGGSLRLTAGYTHKSSIVFEPDNVFVQPAYDLVNGSIEYKPNEKFGIELYVRNLGNTLYNVQMATAAPGYALAGMPRQYGLNLKYSY